MAHDDCICDACRGRRRIARMIEVIQRDMKVQQFEWDGTPAKPLHVSALKKAQ